MPAEVDTGGHWVLHCDSRADCPTATPVCVPISSERLSSVRQPTRTDENERGRVLRNRRRRVERREICAAATEDKNSDFHLDDPARILGIGAEKVEEEEENDLLAKTRAYRRQRDGLTCLVSEKSPRAIENGLSPATWCSREDKIARGKSRLRGDETERAWRAERRSHQDRSRTRRRTAVFLRGTEHRATDYSKRTNVAGRGPLLSSPHSRVRSQEESSEDDSGKFLGECNNDTSTVNTRLNDTEQRDERPEEEKIRRRDDQDTGEDGKKIGRACRVRSILRLILLLFLITFGRCGPHGSSSVLKFSARSAASGLSVLGIGAIVGAVSARPIDLIGDAGTRAERSANLSHITGASRKIQMFIKHRYLQILPDGTVNGSSNDHTSDYTVFQRISVSRGQMKIQGVATCLYLCMDSCGLLYGSHEYTEDCVFNETLEEHNYNTYSSVKWSTSKKTLYLGLNRFGQPRKVSANGHNLGRLSAYARVLTQIAPADLVEALQRRMTDAQHNVRHRHGRHRHHDGDLAHQSLCPSLPKQEKDGRDKFRCRKRKKRKKRKRRCRPGERPGFQCQAVEESIVPGVSSETTDAVDTSVVRTNVSGSGSSSIPESKRSCEGAASEEACRRQALSVPAKKRKSRIDGGGGNLTLNGKNKAPTSNAKKPNVSVADSQSKKPDLTDGKKKKKKKKGPPGLERSSGRGSTMMPPSRKRHGSGTTSSFRASSPRTAPASEEQRASTATSFSYSSPSLPGASTALSSVRKPSLPSTPGRRKPLSSSRNHVTRPAGSSRRVGKSFPGSPGRPRFSAPVTSTTLRSETAHPPTTTKVPESIYANTTPPFTQSSPFPLTFFTSDESIENFSLSDSSAVDEDSSSTVTSESTTETVESSTSAVFSGETTYRSDEESSGSGMADAISKDLTAKFPLERLAM